MNYTQNRSAGEAQWHLWLKRRSRPKVSAFLILDSPVRSRSPSRIPSLRCSCRDWVALAGKHRGLKFDREFLDAHVMFRDMRLTPAHSSAHERVEVGGANSRFPSQPWHRSHNIVTAWTAIALRATPDVQQHTHPIVALVTAGVEMDVLGLAYMNTATRNAKQSCTCICAPRTSRKTSSKTSPRHHPGVLRG